MNTSFETPILLLIFNREKETQKLWTEITKRKPKKIYIAADGPRPGNKTDGLECEKTRKIVTEKINWEGEVYFLFHETNLGCGQAIKQALEWFFENEPEGIILEDDCIPHPDFFDFCSILLNRFRNEEKVFMISGNSLPAVDSSIFPFDYTFTYTPSAWGWATWRRSFQKYDFNLDGLDTFKKQKIIQQIYKERKYQKFWLDFFDEVKKKKINNWDYQLAFTCFMHGGLSIRPKRDLVTNIGTTIGNGIQSVADSAGLKIETHPLEICANTQADNILMEMRVTPLHRIKMLLKKIGLFSIVKKAYKNL